MKRILIFLCGTLWLFCSACFDIVEEITLNADGSGTYETRVNLSGMFEMLMAMAPDSVKEGMDMDQMMDSILNSQGGMGEMQGAIDDMNARDGISNAQQTMSDGVMTISYNFRDLSAIAEANDGQMMDNPLGFEQPDFSGKPGLFVRKQGKTDGDMDAEMEESMQMMEMMMADATYTVIYNFPGKVKKVSNKGVSWSNGNKTITQKVEMLDMLDDPSVLSNTIKYKKK
ncbi:MAG: hypothetical protein AAFR61_19885 [Bacteroidota bacterium]